MNGKCDAVVASRPEGPVGYCYKPAKWAAGWQEYCEDHKREAKLDGYKPSEMRRIDQEER